MRQLKLWKEETSSKGLIWMGDVVFNKSRALLGETIHVQREAASLFVVDPADNGGNGGVRCVLDQ